MLCILLMYYVCIYIKHYYRITTVIFSWEKYNTSYIRYVIYVLILVSFVSFVDDRSDKTSSRNVSAHPYLLQTKDRLHFGLLPSQICVLFRGVFSSCVPPPESDLGFEKKKKHPKINQEFLFLHPHFIHPAERLKLNQSRKGVTVVTVVTDGGGGGGGGGDSHRCES